ncbi:MAG: 23S rRNA (uracil(1939)-C(5))-methyltransferase RlmD [Clostridia bacterium]|nr:23S rRNA (uracil(1939)-C(5))-methyltransferase RlmD [Clostridia bacterium]
MMIKQGMKATITIDSIAAGGDGVGRIDGMAVFVPNTCRGDEAEIVLNKVKSGCAYGTVTKILQPSSCRRADFCALSGACGGCDFAHMTYSEQLLVKHQIVQDALTRIGGFKDVSLSDTLPAPRPERYRNKMVFPFGRDEAGYVRGGFFAQNSHTLVPLDDCRQGDEAVSRYLFAVVEYLEETRTTLYDEKTGRGAARRLFVRLAEGTKEAMVVLVANTKKLKEPQVLIDKLLAVESDYEIKSIMLNIHTKPNNLVLGEQNKVLYGKDTISDVLCGLTFSIGAHSFYQINSPQTERLYNTALDMAELCGNETILDLYCGIGTISLFAAKRAKKVIGVEIVRQAIENAKENAAKNGIINTEFMLGSAESIAPKLAQTGLSPSVVVLDPPRKGAEASALDAIIKMNPEKVVYVSCNPATLARDAKYLCAHGYHLKKATPVDMFPNTSHVECCVLLCRTQQ